MWKLRLKIRELALLSSQLSCRVERRFSGLPKLLHELRDTYVPPRVQTLGLPSPDKLIFRGFQKSPTPDGKSQSDPQRLPHPPSHRRAWGWGVGEKAGPSGNSRPRLPEPRAPARIQPPPPRGRRQQCYHSNAWKGVLGTRCGGASSGPGAQAERRGRAQEAACSLLLRNIPPFLNQ